MKMARRVHILVVDDDQDLRETLMEALEHAGYSVAPAEDGADAFRHLRNSAVRPDLILLDLQMPNMDGREFRAEQLKLDEFRDIPVAVLTADPNGKAMADAMNGVGFLRKPLKLPQVLELIGTTVQPLAQETGGRA